MTAGNSNNLRTAKDFLRGSVFQMSGNSSGHCLFNHYFINYNELFNAKFATSSAEKDGRKSKFRVN